MSRMRRVLAGLLIAAGVLLLADAGVTLVWQEPLGALREHRTQRRLARDLQRLEAAPLPPEGLAAAARVKGTRRKVAVLARAYDRRAAPGAAIGRLDVPRLHLRAVVVPTGVFAASEDFGSAGLEERIDRAASELVTLLGGAAHRSADRPEDPFADPVPFEELLRRA